MSEATKFGFRRLAAARRGPSGLDDILDDRRGGE